MSTRTSIVIDGTPMPPLEEVVARFNRDISYTTDEFDVWDTEPEVHDDGTIHISFNTKWTQTGLGEFARKLTNKYRYIEVGIEEEWNDRDADEQGATWETWAKGKVTKYKQGWVPA